MSGKLVGFPLFPGRTAAKKAFVPRKIIFRDKSLRKISFCGATRIDGPSSENRPLYAALPCGLPVTWEIPSKHTPARVLRAVFCRALAGPFGRLSDTALSSSGGSLKRECVLRTHPVQRFCVSFSKLLLVYARRGGLSTPNFTKTGGETPERFDEIHKSASYLPFLRTHAPRFSGFLSVFVVLSSQEMRA